MLPVPTKFHLTPSGEVRPCVASTRTCSYGEHFTTREEAGVFYENKMTDKTVAFLENDKTESVVFADDRTFDFGELTYQEDVYKRMRDTFLTTRARLVNKSEEDKFTDEEKESLKLFLAPTEYTHDGVLAINGAFDEEDNTYDLSLLEDIRCHGSEPHHGIERELIQKCFSSLSEVVPALDEYLKVHGLNTGDKIVYRGMTTARKDWKLEMGEIIEFPTYLSASFDPQVAFDYSYAEYGQEERMANIVFELHSKNGGYVNGMEGPDREDEREILFARGSRWMIKEEKLVKISAEVVLRVHVLEEIE